MNSKGFLLVVFFFAFAMGSLAQNNTWINYNQQYWNFKSANDDLVKISVSDLNLAGFPTSSTPISQIRLFHNGLEQWIEVQDLDQDDYLNGNDFLLVHQFKNDGFLDASIYQNPTDQANPDYSLFNDTSRVYITINDVGQALRTSVYEAVSDINNLPVVPYVINNSRVEYTSNYYFGVQDQNGIALPWYQEAEGWMGPRFGLGQSTSADVPTPDVSDHPNAPIAKAKTTSASASLATGFVNHHLQVGYGNAFNLQVDTVYYGYQLNRLGFDIPLQELNDAIRITHRSVDDLAVATDFHAVSNIEVQYPRATNFTELWEQFDVQNTSNSPEEVLEIAGFPGSNPRCFVLSGNGIRLELPLTYDGVWKAVVPFDFGPRQRLLLVDESLFGAVSPISPVNASGYFEDYTAQALDSAMIIITHPSLMNTAMNYSAYRESNGLPIKLVNVEELYHQFAFGIWKHPMAIKDFCNDLLLDWESDPSHLFLLGKSIHEMNISATLGARNSPEKYAQNLVPSYGHPTSDLAFTAGLNGANWEVAIPTGRLSAKNGEEVLNYLNKVVEFESSVPDAWMKRVMHFGGGGTVLEQDLFRAYLNLYEGMVEDTCFGGEVFSFYKNSLDPIEINVSDSIQLLINEGVSLMTFFGHASSTGFDVNIDSPSSYSNQGKYPLLIGNSCYTGNIHLSSSLSTSENFVLEPNAGVIGFIAKGDLGLPSLLNLWTENFYRQIFQENYGTSIGQCMRGSVVAWQEGQSSLYAENTALTFSLHGDPSLKLNAWEKPDLSFGEGDVRFEPNEISTELEEFEVHVDVRNIGKLTNDGYGIELIRHFPDGTDTSMVQLVDEMDNLTEVIFTVPVDPLKGPGLNTFDILVDYPAVQLDELENIANNVVLGQELIIRSGNLIPVFPYNYAVIPEAPEQLVASTGDAVLPEQVYRFQIDTSPDFDSPQLQETTVSAIGGVIDWQPNINWQEDEVYYWRTSPDSTAAQGYQWRNSSFEIAEAKRGFGQADAGQWQNNDFNRLELENGQFSFAEATANLKCNVYGAPENSFEALDTKYQINLDVMDYSGCGISPAIHVAVIDSATFAPWESNYNGSNPQNDFGNLMDCTNSRNRPEKYFIFRQNNPDEMAGLQDLLENRIENGHYLLVYSWQYVNYDGWDANAPELGDVFQDLGATQIGMAQDSVPFIFFTKMGYPEQSQELYGSTIDSELIFETTLLGSLGAGNMQTPALGIGNTWDRFEWQVSGDGTDEAMLTIFGADQDGLENDISSWADFTGDVSDLPQELETSTYPEVSLRWRSTDSEALTSSQLEYWRVIGEHVPECALDPDEGFYFPKDSVLSGEELAFAMAVSNVGEYDMDSLLMGYTILQGSQRIRQTIVRLDSLRVGETLVDTVSLPTEGLTGEFTLEVEANTIDPQFNRYDQKEQYRFNNRYQSRIFIKDDQINPVLDVTFDGQHILDGDLVSAAPVIRASLDDENPFLLMDELADTTSFKVFLTDPNAQQIPVYFSEDNVTWIPAGNENKSAFEYYPSFTTDGVYELLVQAQDQSGNSSGSLDYRVSFEVISESSITDVLNYPNPFTTSTQFVFSVTGDSPPDEIYIQIMSISGRIVREIRTEEFGPIRVGRNWSEFRWDGTDQFGDRLANGVYLYRVIAKKNGTALKVRDSGASPYFTKGIGKMYLMR